MKKTLGCLGALGLGVALYAGWVSQPPVRYSKEVNEIMQRCEQREVKEAALAREVDKNAFLSPTFLPYWGRKDKEFQEKSPAKARVDVIADHCDLVSGEDEGLEKAVAEKNPEVQKKFAEFAEFYPTIRETLQKPHFLVPFEGKLNYDVLVPNYLSLRALGQRMSGYVEYLTLTGKRDEAIAVSGDLLRFGWLVGRQQGMLIHRMISTAIQSVGQATLSMALQSDPHPPSPAALDQLVKLLQETHVEMSDFYDCLDCELYMALNSFATLSPTALVDFEPEIPISRLPGIKAREIRLFQNDFVPILQAVRSGSQSDLSWVLSFGFKDWFLGRHGYASVVVIPNTNKARRQTELLRERQSFLHLFASVLRQGVKDQRWPANLKELQASGFEPLSGLDLNRLQYEVKGAQMTLSLSQPEDSLLGPWPVPRPGMEKWELLQGELWSLSASLKP